MPIFALLLLPFVGSFFTALAPTRARTRLASGAGLVATAAAAWIISWFPRVSAGEVIIERVAWLPSLGLDLVLRVDGYAWMFAVLITVLGALVSIYARY